ncbi:hypothetical protein E4U13_006974, partial [Claviceps humidiphila]
MTPSRNEFPFPDKITSGRPQAPSKHSGTAQGESRYAIEKELPTVHASSVRPATKARPFDETQTMQQMLLQTLQQMQQQTQMMQQMMEQMTKLTVKQSTPQVPAPAQTQHQHRYDVGMSEASSPPTLHARSGQMQTTTAAERRQHISKPQYDCRSQIP